MLAALGEVLAFLEAVGCCSAMVQVAPPPRLLSDMVVPVEELQVLAARPAVLMRQAAAVAHELDWETRGAAGRRLEGPAG